MRTTNDHDNANYTAKQATIVLDLLSHKHLKEAGFNRIDCFEYEGRIFRGNYDNAVNHFVQRNPTGGDFGVFLQDNYYTLALRKPHRS